MADRVTPTYGFLGGVNASMPLAACDVMYDMTVESPYDEWEDEGGEAPTSPGDYRMLISALRWGGNATNLADYETWLGPVLRVIDSSLKNGGLPTLTL